MTVLDDLQEILYTTYMKGAAASWGLVQMATAIRSRTRKCPTCRCRISIAADRCMCCASSAIFDAIDDEATQLEGSSRKDGDG